MCNLYSLRQPSRRILGREFDLGPAREKIPPGTKAPVLRLEEGELAAVELKWGFRPAWMSRDWMRAKKRQPPINARAETVATLPLFRSAFQHNRCLIPADGFYEYSDRMVTRGKKQCWYFQREDGLPFAFAGIWSHYQDNDKQECIENFCMITTEPEATVGAVHSRMPAILREQDYLAWLEPAETNWDTAADLLQPYEAEPLVGHAVARESARQSELWPSV